MSKLLGILNVSLTLYIFAHTNSIIHTRETTLEGKRTNVLFFNCFFFFFPFILRRRLYISFDLLSIFHYMPFCLGSIFRFVFRLSCVDYTYYGLLYICYRYYKCCCFYLAMRFSECVCVFRFELWFMCLSNKNNQINTYARTFQSKPTAKLFLEIEKQW